VSKYPGPVSCASLTHEDGSVTINICILLCPIQISVHSARYLAIEFSSRQQTRASLTFCAIFVRYGAVTDTRYMCSKHWQRGIWTNTFIEHSLFTLTNTIIRTYNVLGRFLFNIIHSRTAILGEVSSAQLGAQLSLTLVGYELTGLKVKGKVTLRLTVSQ
jgi:hypothetical protein